MALPLLPLAIAAAPSLIKGGINLAGGAQGKPSAYENKLMRMSDIFDAEASKPLTQTQDFLSGQSILEAQDRKNRKAATSSAATTGATDEAKLATMQGSNETYNQGLNQLLAYASQMRNQNRRQHLNLLGAGENARQGRIHQAQQKLSSILDPLSQAGSAFMMSSVLSPSGMTAPRAPVVNAPNALNLLNQHPAGLADQQPTAGTYS